jgi:aldose 1-epimerase
MKLVLSLLLFPALAALTAPAQTTVTKVPYGKLPDGGVADLYTLKDKALTVQITTWGAHITSVVAPDYNGNGADVVLGYAGLDGYLADDGKTFMGSVVGRYGNRIAGAKFTLDGKAFDLNKNEPTDTLHGGKIGFDRHNWTGKQIPNGVELSLISADGDMGFPGNVIAHVKYTLMGDKLQMEYSATTDKPTVINLTNHSYFNLAGAGDILGQTLMIRADRYTPVDANLIPTGELAKVAGTPFDFTKATAIGTRINDKNDQLKIGLGYDHNFVLNAPYTLTKPAAVLRDPSSGRTLTVFTTEPGVQFYSGNHLDGTMKGRTGDGYQLHAGLCLETQHYPDSPNQPKFPSTTLTPEKPYHSVTVFQFHVTGMAGFPPAP